MATGVDHPGGIRLAESTAVVLAAVSGFVDAFVYLRVYPVFTANQSGNLILAGIAAGERRWGDVFVSALAIACYVAGAALVIALFDRNRMAGRRRLRGALVTEVIVLGMLVLVGTVFGRGRSPSPHVDLATALMVGSTSLAMGIQGVALRRVHGVSVLTTGGTGNVTTLGERLGTLGDPTARRDDGLTLGVIGAVVGIYVIGAAVGSLAAQIQAAGAVLIVFPMVALLVALALQMRRARGSRS